MTKFGKIVCGLAAYVLLTATAHAATTSLWTIERLADTKARITMDGALGLQADSNIDLIGALGTQGAIGAEVPGGDFLLGGLQIGLTFGRPSTFDLSLNIIGDAPSGATATGALIVTLNPEIWAAVGTTGSVLNRPAANGGLEIGTFEIVAATVPLPATLPLALFAFGALGAIGVRRRQR